MDKQYETILKEYEEISRGLAANPAPEQLKTLGRRQVQLLPLVEKIHELQKLELQISDNEKLLFDSDDEIRQAAAEEKEILNSKLETLNSELQEELVPRDPLDNHDIIMEIRAGAGGDEAGLFAAELFRMYQKFVVAQKWKIYVISSNRTEVGGFKEIIFEINGAGVYGKLKYESGVHRVQRVPEM